MTFVLTKIDCIFLFFVFLICLVSFTFFGVLNGPFLRSGLIACLAFRRQTMSGIDELLIFYGDLNATEVASKWLLGGLDLWLQNR